MSTVGALASPALSIVYIIYALSHHPNFKNNIPSFIKAISVNCCSLQTQSRRARLYGLIHEHMPNVIVGCESHLDDSFTSAKTFPKGFQVYRKDRSIGGGGVFLAVKDTLAVTELITLDVDAELIWIKIKPLYICSYYRPLNSELKSILQLNESMANLVKQNPCCNIILAGDFNLRSIKWDDGQGTVLPDPYGCNLNDTFFDIVSNLDHAVYVLTN